MRLLTKWLSLWACIGLILMPVSTLHAHFDADHRQVLVHAGHDHEFEHNAEVAGRGHELHDADHLAIHRDSHDGRSHDDFGSGIDGSTWGTGFEPLLFAPHHVHVVSMQAAKVDIGFKRWWPTLATRTVRIDDPPDAPFVVIHFADTENRIARPRFHLNPPLRGPPALPR